VFQEFQIAAWRLHYLSRHFVLATAFLVATIQCHSLIAIPIQGTVVVQPIIVFDNSEDAKIERLAFRTDIRIANEVFVQVGLEIKSEAMHAISFGYPSPSSEKLRSYWTDDDFKKSVSDSKKIIGKAAHQAYKKRVIPVFMLGAFRGGQWPYGRKAGFTLTQPDIAIALGGHPQWVKFEERDDGKPLKWVNADSDVPVPKTYKLSGKGRSPDTFAHELLHALLHTASASQTPPLQSYVLSPNIALNKDYGHAKQSTHLLASGSGRTTPRIPKAIGSNGQLQDLIFGQVSLGNAQFSNGRGMTIGDAVYKSKFVKKRYDEVWLEINSSRHLNSDWPPSLPKATTAIGYHEHLSAKQKNIKWNSPSHADISVSYVNPFEETAAINQGRKYHAVGRRRVNRVKLSTKVTKINGLKRTKGKSTKTWQEAPASDFSVLGANFIIASATLEITLEFEQSLFSGTHQSKKYPLQERYGYHPSDHSMTITIGGIDWLLPSQFDKNRRSIHLMPNGSKIQIGETANRLRNEKGIQVSQGVISYSANETMDDQIDGKTGYSIAVTVPKNHTISGDKIIFLELPMRYVLGPLGR